MFKQGLSNKHIPQDIAFLLWMWTYHCLELNHFLHKQEEMSSLSSWISNCKEILQARQADSCFKLTGKDITTAWNFNEIWTSLSDLLSNFCTCAIRISLFASFPTTVSKLKKSYKHQNRKYLSDKCLKSTWFSNLELECLKKKPDPDRNSFSAWCVFQQNFL